ncbi:sugar kinase [Geodermatophilus sp. YIM 151500]|uniref:sugar kinase n=1 Tax=Geodermatophilus sp. YIM 151500 TaxID=2984531 RepID=UPI0021E377D2|nr:sugar kinase [Geodermatophilus sp. YIM 151500]MCV2489166.1 sugar kinase [Geodermatophilus sp. YIM 151500]
MTGGRVQRPYVVTLGETMALIRADQPGPLAHAPALGLGIGGAESNVAIGLARLGTDVAWCGRVGDDALGVLVRREIRAEGVRTHVRVDADAPTGLMIKERRTPATQKVAYYRAGSAGSRLAPDDVPADLVEDATLLHVSGITAALSPSARATLLDAVDRARSAAVAVSFDVNHRSSLWSDEESGAFARDLLERVDVVFAGEDEAALVVGPHRRAEDAAAELAGLGPSEVVVKRGAQGALSLVDGAVHTAPAVPVAVVDTVGAGDAFVAGYLAERVAGGSPAERLALAVTTGAFACLTAGDWEGLPRREELSLLTDREPVRR